MKTIPGILAVLLTSGWFACTAAGAPRKIAFERNDNSVWVANLDGSGARKIAAGVDPDISPDGSKLAFNTEDGNSPVRYIAVADLPTGKITLFKNVPSDNCFGPVWAPDGKKLLFYIFLNKEWDIGLADPDGGAFRILKKAQSDSHSFYSACWTPDGQSLYCQDLDNLYHIGLDGAVIKQWPLQKILSGGDVDSGVRLGVSPDGRTLLAELGTEAVPERKDWDGPAPSIWALDLASEKARKVTAQFWWQPYWLSNTEFLCIAQGEKEKRPSIYRVSLDGITHKLLIKNATEPSVSK